MTATEKACEALCRTLEQGNDVHRCFAAQALGHIAIPRALDALAERLWDEDEDVRIDAAEALGALGDRRAGAALLNSLRDDPCGDVKVKAVEALGRLGDAEFVPLLRRLVRDRDDAITWDEFDSVAGGWDDWLDIQVKAIEALGKLGAAGAVADIVAAIDDEMGQDVSEPGMRALARLGAPGIEALARYVKHSDSRLRRRAVAALAAAGSRDACEALGGALADGSTDVRLAAVRGWPVAFAEDPRLARCLEDPDPQVREAAVGVCGRRYPERLDAMLDDASDRVQAAVIGLIATNAGATPTGDLTQRLRVKLRGPSVEAAEAAASALAALAPGVAFDDLAEQTLDTGCPNAVRSAAARALAGYGSEPAAHVLVQALASADRQLRLTAAAGLARIAAASGSDFALQALLSGLRGELIPPAEAQPPSGAETPASAAPAGDPRAESPVSTLDAILEANVGPAASGDDDARLDAEDLEYLALARRAPRKKRVSPDPKIAAHEDIPRVAARMLGDVARDEAARALGDALANKDTEIRHIAAASLAHIGERTGRFGEDVVAALVVAAGDSDRNVRQLAARALGSAGRGTAAPVLLELLGDADCFIRAEAARALGRLGTGREKVAALLADEDAGVRLAAAGALAAAAGADAIAPLFDFVFAFDGHHRREAARLLKDLDAETLSARLIAVLGDSERKPVWRVAIEALDELHRRDRTPCGASNGHSPTHV